MMDRRLFLASASLPLLFGRQGGAPRLDDDSDDGFTGTIADEIAHTVIAGYDAHSAVAMATLTRVWNRHITSKGVTDHIDTVLTTVEGPMTLSGKPIADYWAKRGLVLSIPDQALSARDVAEGRAKIVSFGGAAGFHEAIAQAFDNWADKHPERGGRQARPQPLVVWGAGWDCFCKAMMVEAAALSLGCLAGLAPICGPAVVLAASETILQYGFGACAPMNCTA